MKTLNTLKTFLYLVFILGFVVGIHELGHFMFGLAVGFPVESFNIGFGPTIFSHVVEGKSFNLNLIPLGGYVELKEGFDYLKYDHFFSSLIFLSAGIINNFFIAYLLLGNKFKNIFFEILLLNEPFKHIKTIGEVIGLISIAIGLLNLIPIAPLDGGKIFALILYSMFGETAYHIYHIISALLFIPFIVFANCPSGPFKDLIIIKIKYFVCTNIYKNSLCINDIYYKIYSIFYGLVLAKHEKKISDEKFFKYLKKLLFFLKKVKDNDILYKHRNTYNSTEKMIKDLYILHMSDWKI